VSGDHAELLATLSGAEAKPTALLAKSAQLRQIAETDSVTVESVGLPAPAAPLSASGSGPAVVATPAQRPVARSLSGSFLVADKSGKVVSFLPLVNTSPIRIVRPTAVPSVLPPSATVLFDSKAAAALRSH